VTKSDTHEIEINLIPPGQEAEHEIREALLDLALVDAIETVRAVVASTADGDYPFELNDEKITLSFAVNGRRRHLDRHRRKHDRRGDSHSCPRPHPQRSPGWTSVFSIEAACSSRHSALRGIATPRRCRHSARMTHRLGTVVKQEVGAQEP
jgi:hypothetical protein